MTEPLLQIRDLRVRLEARGHAFFALDGASLEVARGQMVGLVGESGCGKTTLALSVVRLLPRGAEIVSGSVRLQGAELTKLTERELRAVRGARVGFVPQDAGSALNPVLTIGDQLSEAARAHGELSRAEARNRAIEVLRAVAIAAPEATARCHPHQLSGGMKQRTLLAMALAASPALLVADEPTTSIDATLQQELLELLDRLRRERALGILLISHDLGLVARHCQKVAVMYAGRVVEQGGTERLIASAAHPYTAALLAARPGQRGERAGERLRVISGSVPDPLAPEPGCPFAPRCERAEQDCRAHAPGERELGPDRRVQCLHPLGDFAAAIGSPS